MCLSFMQRKNKSIQSDFDFSVNLSWSKRLNTLYQIKDYLLINRVRRWKCLLFKGKTVDKMVLFIL